MSKKVFIKTFGCQMNEYGSDKMADVLGAAQGYESIDDVEQADLIIFNTCSVREKAQESMTTFEHKAAGAALNIEIERSTQVMVDTVRAAVEEKLGPLMPALEKLLAQQGIKVDTLFSN